MKNFLRFSSAFLLLINGAGAVYGGWNLMFYPDGSSLGMPLYHLEHSPFRNFLIPGIILFSANGLFSLFVIGTIVFRVSKYPLFIVAQGVILSGWIVIQCFMLQAVGTLHIVFFGIGLLLVICGWLLKWNESIRKRKLVSL